MPALLPPLNEATTLEAPKMQPQVSDWSTMPPLMPPLMNTNYSDPSQFHPVLNVVPTIVPQGSWETSMPQNVPTPQWLQVNANPTFPQDVMARPNRLEFLDSNDVNTREMEFLSNAPQQPVMYGGYENYMLQQPTGVMITPALQPNALVHFPFTTLAASII